MTGLLVATAVELTSLVAAFSNSVASADYWVRKTTEGRNRDVAVSCACPVCKGTHERGSEYQERGIPATVNAFFLSERELLVEDLGVRAANLERIEVRFGGATYAAREVARVARPAAVVLETARPVAGAKGIDFAPGAVSNWLHVAEHDGEWKAGLSPESAETGLELRLADGRLTRKIPAPAIGLDGAGRAVTVSLDERIDSAATELVPPSAWPRLAADDYEKAACAVETRLAQSVVSVLVRLEPPKREESGRFALRSDNESRTDFDEIGFIAPDGTVVVCSKLTGEQIGRLAKAEATLPDGTRAELAFAGAFADWNLLALTFKGALPASVKPLEFSSADPLRLFDERLWAVESENENGRLRLTVTRGRPGRVLLTRDNVPAPTLVATGAELVPQGRSRFSFGCEAEGSLVVDDAGRVLSALFTRRFSKNRWSNDRETLAASAVARLFRERPFNPEFAPRVEDERNRLVWLGVESVALTDALAREKKAQSYVGEYRRPPLVTEVYSNSPAAKAGIRVDDILLAVRRGDGPERPLEAGWNRGFDALEFFSFSEYGPRYGSRGTPWPDVENEINRELTKFGVGANLTLVYARDGARRETALVLEAAPVHYRNAKRCRNRTLGLSVADLTFEVRRFFKFGETDPGVVIVKVKPGSPAAVAGLLPCELVTEVNGEKIAGAKDFAAKVKDRESLTLAVRRLAETRMVRLQAKAGEKDAASRKVEEKEEVK